MIGLIGSVSFMKYSGCGQNIESGRSLPSRISSDHRSSNHLLSISWSTAFPRWRRLQFRRPQIDTTLMFYYWFNFLGFPTTYCNIYQFSFKLFRLTKQEETNKAHTAVTRQLSFPSCQHFEQWVYTRSYFMKFIISSTLDFCRFYFNVNQGS